VGLVCLVVVVIVVGSWIASPDVAQAHTRSVSYSTWRFEEAGARVKVRIPRLELTRIALDAPPEDAVLSAQAARYLAGRLLLTSGDSTCHPVGSPEQRSADEGWAAFSWSYACPAGAPDQLETAILLDVAPSHAHFARVNLSGGRVRERVLTESAPSWAFSTALAPGQEGNAAEATGSSVASYVVLGIEHILSGWDHLAFVLALLILAGSLREMARVITGFTIAHSLTLGLAVLGFVHPEAAAVEAIIGFSVALVAAENAWALAGRGKLIPVGSVGLLTVCAVFALAGYGAVSAISLVGLAVFSGCHFAMLERSERPARIRAALAFAFGLVHGFGFAGVLGEMQLPTERLAPALFGFNVGVELGQLAVVVLIWPLLRGLERLSEGRIHRFAVDAASAGICGLGLFWFITRAFGDG
jgi:hypothetical protein